MENELNHTLVYQWQTTSNYPIILDKVADFLNFLLNSQKKEEHLYYQITSNLDINGLFTGKDGYLQR